MADPKAPTRDELFKVFKNHALVIKIEKLFEQAGSTTPSEIEELSVAVGIADAKANQANGNVVTDHSQLRNLLWSVAGHIIDTVLQMNGNTIAGDDASGGNLTFTSTSHATKSDIFFGVSAPRMIYKEDDNKLELGTITFNAEDSRAEIGDPGFEGSGIDIDGTVVKTGLRVNDFNDDNPYQIISHRHSLVNAANILGARSKSDSSSHGSVVDGDTCFQVLGVGWTGSHYDKFGEICISADAGTISATSSPGKICFSTVPDGTHTMTERVCIKEDGNVGINLTAPQEKLAIAGNIVLPKASGNGIKIDNTTPTFGWRDLLGEVRPKETGAGKPTYSTFRGNIKGWVFTTNDVVDLVYHIPHDWVHGSDIYLHVHWTHNGTAISGSLIIDHRWTYAKGHNQSGVTYPAETTFTQTVSTPDITTYPQYSHPISEDQFSKVTPSAGEIDTDDLEPDGLIKISAKTTTVPTITGGDFFIDYIDIHYQSTNIATKEKAPDFYT